MTFRAELFASENKPSSSKIRALRSISRIAGTSKQARSIIEGLGEADVVTFQPVDGHRFPREERFRFQGLGQGVSEQRFAVYSFPSFLVRAGNPKNIKDWGDLARDDMRAVFPNPKTSGNARYTYLAAYAWAKEAYNGDEGRSKPTSPRSSTTCRSSTPAAARSTTAFVEARDRRRADHLRGRDRGIEKRSTARQGAGDPVGQPACGIPRGRGRQGRRQAAAPRRLRNPRLPVSDGQRIAAQFGHRVRNEKVAGEFKGSVSAIRLVNVNDTFGGWGKIQKEHFASGGILDKLYGSR